MNWDVLARYAPSLLGGFGVTIFCWTAGSLIGLALGFLIALGAESRSLALRGALRVCVEILRGTPFLMQLFILYAGGPAIGLRLTATEAGVVGLGVYSSAYYSEIFRAGFAAVPRRVLVGISHKHSCRPVTSDKMQEVNSFGFEFGYQTLREFPGGSRGAGAYCTKSTMSPFSVR